MMHFGRSGPPAVRDTFSLLVLNVSFHKLRLPIAPETPAFARSSNEFCIDDADTTIDDLFPLLDRCGDVVVIYIPRDRRTGDSRGFAFVRYKYENEAQKAVDKHDGKLSRWEGHHVAVRQYGPNAERIQKGRIVEEIPNPRGYSRKHSPRPRYQDDYRDRHNRRRSQSRRVERYERDRPKDDRHRGSMVRSINPDYDRRHSRHSCSLAPGRRSHNISHTS